MATEETMRNQSIEIDRTTTRQELINGCSKCNGSPEVEPLNLPEFEGTKCKDCLQVVDYKKKEEKTSEVE